MRRFCCYNRKWERSSPLSSNKLCSGCFWLMHFLYSEMPKITSFSHCISPRLPESATKVAISILRVNYTWDSAVHCHFTLPHSCTFTFWVPFWPNFHFFSHFSASNWHFYHHQRLQLRLSCLVPAFSSLAVAFSKLSITLSWLLWALVLETKKNTKKTQKWGFFLQVLSFSQKSTLLGVVTFMVERHWPAPMILHRKRCIFKIFANHTPSERLIWS